MTDRLQEIFKQIDSNKKPMIELQRLLTSVPAIAPESGGQGELEKADKLMEYLKKTGIADIEVIYVPDDRVESGKRPNVIVTISGDVSEPRFWIMSHTDVVPSGEEALWKSNPYELVEKDGKIIGRGVEDNQQGLVASVYAALSILQLGFKPYYTVKLLFVADEEVGSNMGIKYLLDNHELFKEKDFFLVPDVGNSEGSMIEIAEKTMYWIKFKTTGRQCHGSVPEHGNNAFLAGSDLVMQLNVLNNIFSIRNELFDPPYSTFAPTKKEANVPNINTIPGEDVFYFDCRILPEIKITDVNKRIDEIILKIEKKHNVKIEYSPVMQGSSIPTQDDAPIVASVKKAVKEVYGVEGRPMGVGGGTVAAFLRNAGFNTVVWEKVDETAHMPNEYCIIDNMLGDAKVMACIMMGL